MQFDLWLYLVGMDTVDISRIHATLGYRFSSAGTAWNSMSTRLLLSRTACSTVTYAMRPSLRLLSVLPPSIHSLLAKVPTQDTSVKVQGWLKSVRAHKNVAFASIDDGSGSTLQAVFKRPQNIDLCVSSFFPLKCSALWKG